MLQGCCQVALGSGVNSLLKSSLTFSIGSRSRLWLSHSRTNTLLSSNHLRSFHWMIQVIVLLENKPSPKMSFSWKPESGFPLGFPYILLSLYHASWLGWCFLWWCAVLGVVWWPEKLYFLLPSDQRTFCQLTFKSPRAFSESSRWDLMSFLLQWLTLCHSPIQLWLVKYLGNSCWMQSLSHLSCWSFYLLQSCHRCLRGLPQ